MLKPKSTGEDTEEHSEHEHEPLVRWRRWLRCILCGGDESDNGLDDEREHDGW